MTDTRQAPRAMASPAMARQDVAGRGGGEAGGSQSLPRPEVMPVYKVRVTFSRNVGPVLMLMSREYQFTTAMNRDRFVDACRPLGGVAVAFSLDHVVSVEQALSELAEESFFAAEPSEWSEGS